MLLPLHQNQFSSQELPQSSLRVKYSAESRVLCPCQARYHDLLHLLLKAGKDPELSPA